MNGSKNQSNFTACRIRRLIFNSPPGTIFTTNQFLQYGPRTSVDKALFRLVRSGDVTRLARGVFARLDSKKDTPSAWEIAGAKAAAFGKQIFEHGASIASRMNLGSVHQKENTFSINGSSTSFNTVAGRVYLRSTCQRKTHNQGTRPKDLVTALWQMGRGTFGRQTVVSGMTGFTRQEREEIRTMGGIIPDWLQNMVCSQYRWAPPRAPLLSWGTLSS